MIKSFGNKKRAVRHSAKTLAVNYPGDFQLVLNHAPYLQNNTF